MRYIYFILYILIFFKTSAQNFTKNDTLKLDKVFVSGSKIETLISTPPLNSLIINSKEIENFGVSRIVYTDINKDGTKKGPNIKDTVELSSKVKIPLVISGGVSSIEDIKKIKSLNNSNIEGVIVGKSIYDGDIKISDLTELI